MLRKCALTVGLAAALLVTPAGAQMLGSVGEMNVIEVIGNGQVNWTVGTVRATGIGAYPPNASNPVQAAAMAERAAITVARRNLLEIVKGVRIDSSTTVENFVATSDVIKSKVRGFIQGARVVEKKTLPAGGISVVMEIKLRGPFADTLLPEVIQTPVAPSVRPSTPAKAPDTVYTGLVVDARGLGVRPAMAPKIIDEKGEEIYGSAYVSRNYAIQQGMAGYSRSLEAARKNERVTDKPLVVKALKSAGASSSDIVISNVDARTLQAAAQKLKFLEQCKVMIILD